MNKLKELRNECLKLHHQLWEEGKRDNYLKYYLLAVETAEKARDKPLNLEDYIKLSDKVWNDH